MSCINTDPSLLTYRSASRHILKNNGWKKVPKSIGSEWGQYTWIGSWEAHELNGWFEIVSSNAVAGGKKFDHLSKFILDKNKNGVYEAGIDPTIGRLYHNSGTQDSKTKGIVALQKPYKKCDTGRNKLPSNSFFRNFSRGEWKKRDDLTGLPGNNLKKPYVTVVEVADTTTNQSVFFAIFDEVTGVKQGKLIGAYNNSKWKYLDDYTSIYIDKNDNKI